MGTLGVTEQFLDQIITISKEVLSIFTACQGKSALVRECKGLAWTTVKLLVATDNFSLAGKVGLELVEILAKCGISSCVRDSDLTRLWLWIAAAENGMEEYEKSLEILQPLFPLLEKNKSNNFSVMEVAEAEQVLATNLLYLKKYQEALKITQRSYEKLKDSAQAGPHHWRTVDVLNLQAFLLCYLGNFEKPRKSANL